MAPRLTDLELKKIKKMYKQGYSILKISNELDRSDWTIRKYIKDMELEKPKKVVDLVGQKFGKLTVIKLDHEENRRRYWKCQCECGNTTVVREGNLKSGTTKSCGCLKKNYIEHKKLNVKQVKTRNNQGGVYYFQPGEIILKGNYEVEGYKRGGKIKKYKLSPQELQKYLEELETKEVKRRGR